jgi:undecaprenyl pyrophosphate phosphatase UppP
MRDESLKTPPVIAFSLFITGCFLIFIERFHHIGNKTEKTMGWTGALPLAVAFIASFVFSILSIKWLINFLNNSRLNYFAL